MNEEIGPAESKADLFVSTLDAADHSVIGPYQTKRVTRKQGDLKVKTDVVITDADVSGLADPDDRTLTKIYVAFAPMLRAFAAQKGSADSDDVVQEVFIKFIVAVRRRKFVAHSVGEVVAYLRTLVRHHVIDDYRRAAARCQDMMVELDEFAVPVSSTVYHDLDVRDADALRQRSEDRVLASWKCSDTTKAVFVACVIDGRDIADVASQFGVSCGLVRQIRHRGLARMRALKDVWFSSRKEEFDSPWGCHIFSCLYKNENEIL